MRQLARATPLLVVAAVATGCATYRPAPLDPRAELDALRDRDLTRFVVERAVPGQDGVPADHPFDPSDGLDEAEVVSVALTLNPDLRARRQEIGEARAQLIAAGLWPNPEAGVSWKAGVGGASGYSVDADALFELLRPGERAARRSAAAAQLDAVRADVVAEEFKTAAQVRAQRLQVLAADQLVSLLDEDLGLRRNALDLVRRRRELGEGTALDVSTAELEVAEAARDLRRARSDRAAQRIELNRVLGLPPEYDLRLAEAGRPLAVTVFEDVTDEELDHRVLAGRVELRAAEAAYRRAEQELRLAVLQQYPRLGVGPAYERELEGDSGLGLGLSLELPLFNQNQGEIAERTAQRERRRAEYAALLHGLRTSAYAARAALRLARQEVAAQEDEILPLVRRNQELLDRAFTARELSIIELTTARQRSLRARQEYLQSLVRYRTAVIELETSTGLPLSQRPAAAPTTRPGAGPPGGARPDPQADVNNDQDRRPR